MNRSVRLLILMKSKDVQAKSLFSGESCQCVTNEWLKHVALTNDSYRRVTSKTNTSKALPYHMKKLRLAHLMESKVIRPTA